MSLQRSVNFSRETEDILGIMPTPRPEILLRAVNRWLRILKMEDLCKTNLFTNGLNSVCII